MKPQRAQLLAGWQELSELTAIIGDERETQRLLFVWTGMASMFAGERDDFFTGPDPETDAERVKKMRSAVEHIDALLPLLDRRMAWLIAVQTPGFDDGPEVAHQTEDRLDGLGQSLAALRLDIERAAVAIKPKKGRPLRPTPPLMLLVSLTGSLEELGVPFSDAENSKMVRAVRLFWQAAGLDGDPRDHIRSLKTRREGA